VESKISLEGCTGILPLSQLVTGESNSDQDDEYNRDPNIKGQADQHQEEERAFLGIFMLSLFFRSFRLVTFFQT
jgi:hypothetical protein